MTLGGERNHPGLLVVSTIDLILFPYTDSLHATMSDDQGGERTRPL